MFNLKNKAKKIVNGAKRYSYLLRNPSDIIAEIHLEFDSSAEKLLSEAKKILLEKEKMFIRGIG